MKHSADPWDTRFGFFWYNDREIFEFGDSDFERRAAELADSGINHVITFSCTHFRWSFRSYWELLTEILARIVRACHKHGIAVTEHHSSHLTFNPLNDDDERYMDRILHVRGSSRSSWPGMRADCDADPIIEGEPMSSFRQIDGRTGEWARSSYRGWCMCFNNPTYRRAYFSYLETLYGTGIDGIMTDDVQYFGRDEQTGRYHACACRHCRRLFAEKTGHELPRPGEEWSRWHSDYSDPSFVAWLQFRQDSTRGFHQAVKEHYTSLGLRPLRPNYCSAVLNRNPTGYCLETLPDLDWIFKENCFSSVIKYSWPDWAVEAANRFAVGRHRSIPAMEMFYPDRDDTMQFSWALAMSWGQLYLATPEGTSLNEEEKPLRRFEKKYARLLRRVKNVAALGCYDSRRNRTLYEHAERRSLRQMKAWMQACYRSNLPFDLFQTEELLNGPRHDVIVLNETALMSDEEMSAVAQFAGEGGTVVWTGRTGALRPDGTARPEGYLAELWGFRTGQGPEPAEDGSSRSELTVGKGRLVICAADDGPLVPEPVVRADRWQEEDTQTPYAAITDEESSRRRELGQFLRAEIAKARNGAPRGCVVQPLNGTPEDITITAFETEDSAALVLHVVNTCGAVTGGDDGAVGHGDHIPFPSLGPNGEIAIRILPPAHMRERKLVAVRIHRPDGESRIADGWSRSNAGIEIHIGPEAIRYYALVEMEFSR